MAELTLAPPPDRSPLTSILIAAAILAAIAVAMFLFIPRDTAKLTVTNVQIFASSTVFKPMHNAAGMNIVGQESAIEDDLYVVATVHLEDKFRMPVSVDAMSGTLTTSDGATKDGASVARADITRLGSIFPTLTPMLPHPIGYGDEVAPGKSLDGQIVLQFPGVNAQAWQSKKSASLTLLMHNQPAQTVTLK